MQTLAGKGVSGLWPAVLRAACSARAFSRSFSSWLLCTFMFSPSLPSCRGRSTSQHVIAPVIMTLAFSRGSTSAIVNQQTCVVCSLHVGRMEQSHFQSTDVNLRPLTRVSRLTLCMAAEAAVWRM